MPPLASTDGADMAYLPTAGPGVRAMLAADPSFDVAHFLEGAQAAYRMILEAYWKGDLEAMRPHVDGDVYETFAGAVDRARQGGPDARQSPGRDRAGGDRRGRRSKRPSRVVTVRFEADIAAVTRNREGEVVAGSLSDAVQTRDLWTFRRDLATRDPNWLLIETDEEE